MKAIAAVLTLCGSLALSHLLATTAWAAGSDDTLRLYMSKSDLIVSGTLVSKGGGIVLESGVVNYLCELKVAETLHGKNHNGETIKVNIVRFEHSGNNQLPYLSKGAECLLFLKDVSATRKPPWQSADHWFGIQPNLAAMRRSIKRLSEQQLQADAAYQAAIETIATSTDQAAVEKADRLLRSGGHNSIRTLLRNLNDRRIPPTGYGTRATDGKSEVGLHCFWMIQSMIETLPPKSYSSKYMILTRDNVTGWLATRKNKSLDELKMEAALLSLQRAQKKFETDPTRGSKEIVKRYQGVVDKLRK